MTITEFKTALANHDWFYYFSDDHRVWTRGEEAGKKLINIARNSGVEFQAAYNDEYARHFNTESFYPKNGDRKYSPPFQLAS